MSIDVPRPSGLDITESGLDEGSAQVGGAGSGPGPSISEGKGGGAEQVAGSGERFDATARRGRTRGR